MNIVENQKLKSLYIYMIILIIIIKINLLLVVFGIFTWQVASALYFAVAFMVAFTFGAQWQQLLHLFSDPLRPTNVLEIIGFKHEGGD